MAVLNIVTGDATKPTPIKEGSRIIIAHVTNLAGCWGAGFVNGITATFGECVKNAFQAWHHGEDFSIHDENEVNPLDYGCSYILCPKKEFRLGHAQFVVPENSSNIMIANLLAQDHFMNKNGRIPLRYAALMDAMRMVAAYHDGETEIHIPRMGSGLAGGKYEAIEDMVRELWVDLGLSVVIYNYPS